MSVEILKPGDPTKRVPFFMKRTWTCRRCGCEWRVINAHAAKFTDDQREGPFAHMTCPTCGEIAVVQATREGYWGD